jgi:hypothetical protein
MFLCSSAFLDKENEDAEAAKIAKMEKEIAKYKKQQNLQKKSAQKNKAGTSSSLCCPY